MLSTGTYTSSSVPPVPPLPWRSFKEAVSECTAALDGQPNFFKALVRRAKALEQLGQHKVGGLVGRFHMWDGWCKDDGGAAGPAQGGWAGGVTRRQCHLWVRGMTECCCLIILQA